jgi:N-dimethylarginine dimethylaminohydrolase
VIENEQADSRRQVALLALSINFKSKFFDRNILMGSDFFERGPKRVFQADTGLTAVDLHRSLNNWRFRHQPLATAKLHSVTSSARAGRESRFFSATGSCLTGHTVTVGHSANIQSTKSPFAEGCWN